MVSEVPLRIDVDLCTVCAGRDPPATLPEASMHPRNASRVLRPALLALLLAVPTAAVPTPATAAGPPGASLADGCDPVDPAACLLPFPSDLYTVADPATDTG